MSEAVVDLQMGECIWGAAENWGEESLGKQQEESASEVEADAVT